MAENGYMTELTDIVMADEDGNAVINLSAIMKDHIEGLTRSGVEYIAALKPMIDAANTDLTNLNVEEGSPSTTDSSSDSGDSGGDDDGFDFGDDMGDDATDMESSEDTEEAAPADDAVEAE
jgi:hypothetical protein